MVLEKEMECSPLTLFQQNLWAALAFLAAASLIQYLYPLLCGTETGRLTLRRILRILLRSTLAFGIYTALGASLPYICPPKPTKTDRAVLPADYYGAAAISQRAALISDNREALTLRLQMIREAREQIILTTFSIHGDDSGLDLCAALLEAADRGVQVGILTDGFDAMTDNDGKLPFTALAAHPNISFHVYAPGNVLRPGKAMARMHEKYLICDGETLLLGGRNCHDYFLGDYPARIHNIDLDVLVTGGGAVIEQLTARYQAVLARKDTLSLPAETDPKIIESCFNQLRAHAAMLSEDLPAFDYASRTASCNQITLIASSIEPKPKAPIVWQALCDLMENAEEEVLVHTPYLICSRAMKQDLARIAQNTALRITINSPCTSANLFGAAVYLNDKQNLLDTGADILEYHGSRSSHTKAICIDERLAVVGSFNFDMRSAYIDSELMLAIDSPELARQLKTFMEAVETQATPAGDPMLLDISPARGRMIGLLRLFERPFRHLL